MNGSSVIQCFYSFRCPLDINLCPFIFFEITVVYKYFLTNFGLTYGQHTDISQILWVIVSVAELQIVDFSLRQAWAKPSYFVCISVLHVKRHQPEGFRNFIISCVAYEFQIMNIAPNDLEKLILEHMTLNSCCSTSVICQNISMN